jgi:hypothetical protein
MAENENTTNAVKPQQIVQNANLAWLVQTVERQERERACDAARMEALEREVSGSVKRRDSIEWGTPSKGGACKVYLDLMGDPKANEAIIAEAKRLQALATGQQAGGA